MRTDAKKGYRKRFHVVTVIALWNSSRKAKIEKGALVGENALSINIYDSHNH